MSQTAILIGFDRSGTSAISRTLAAHPSIELFMQPFNSGPLRSLMYKILSDDIVSNEDRAFFNHLSNGKIDTDYIKSHWFFEHSTTTSFVPNALHIIKSTISHFKVPWIQQHFPEIEVWGIWREPLDILRSIFRNGFESWYEGSFADLSETIAKDQKLSELFGSFLSLDSGVREKVALNLAVRSLHFFRHIEADKVIQFEHFCNNAGMLNRFCVNYKLERFEFSDHSKRDHNIIGTMEESERPDPFSGVDMESIEAILAPLRNEIEPRLNPDQESLT